MQTGTQVADKAVDGILQRIDALAAKIGTTAQHVWEVYVAQAKVEAVRDTATGVFFVIVSALLSYLAYRLFLYGIKVGKSKGDESPDWPFITGSLAALVTVIFLVIAISVFYSALGEWINPQYWAFQHLAQDIKGLL